jgi:hypothetical protein
LEYIMVYTKTFAQLVEDTAALAAAPLALQAESALSLVEKHESGESPLSPQSVKRCYAVLEVATS